MVGRPYGCPPQCPGQHARRQDLAGFNTMGATLLAVRPSIDTCCLDMLKFRYLSSIAISLFFFNLLPLPSTDGSHLLRALLSLRQPILQARQWRAAISRPHAHPTINIYREYELDSDSEADSERGGDYESGSMRERSREEVWKRRLRRGVEGVSTALVAIWAAGWAMVALLRSS